MYEIHEAVKYLLKNLIAEMALLGLEETSSSIYYFKYQESSFFINAGLGGFSLYGRYVLAKFKL